MQDYRKLKVWDRANDLAPRVRDLTGTFPKRDYTSMKNQMHSAVESIPFNIAEGCGTDSPKEFGRFLDIAVKSACELDAQLHLAARYGIADKRVIWELEDEVEQIRRMLRALRKKVLA
jgi:four helix bundle protein